MSNLTQIQLDWEAYADNDVFIGNVQNGYSHQILVPNVCGTGLDCVKAPTSNQVLYKINFISKKCLKSVYGPI